MTRVIIFANGELHPPLPSPRDFKPEDILIAADGGAHHYAMLGVIPHVLIGDFDSLQHEEVRKLETLGVEIARHPARKDETDLELALLHAVELGASEIIVYAALGARWDMTLANLMLLTHPMLKHTQLRLIDGSQEIQLLRSGQSLSLTGNPGDTISLIPLSTESSGITTQDLEYSLNDGTLTLGSPRGVSNIMRSNQCEVKLEHGLLAVVQLHQEIAE